MWQLICPWMTTMEVKKNKYLMYLDTNNLYGEAMAKYLPIIGLKWLIVEGNMDVCIIHSQSNYRYILKNLQHLQKVHIRFSTTTNNFVFL